MPVQLLLSRRPLRFFAERLRWRVERSRLARLTIVSQYHPPDFAATGQFIADLSSRLAERGLQNLVLTGQPGYAFRREEAERIEFLPNRCIRRTAMSRFWPERIRGRVVNSLLFCLRTLLRLLRQGRRGDLLLFSTEPAYLPIVGWLAHLLTRAPYVVLVYDLYPDIAVSLGVVTSDHPVVRLWRLLQGQALSCANEIIVLSTTMQTHLRQHYPQVSKPITVIPSWADPDLIRPMPRSANHFTQLQGLGDHFVVLYSGNQGRCHDLNTLLDAAERLQNQPHILFLIVGAGAQHKSLVERVKRQGLSHVRFLPYQEADQLPALLASADLAVVSLLEAAEGQVAPSKLYGHLAAATPVAAICAPHSYLRTELARADCGQAFSSGDSEGLAAFIRELSVDRDRARRLGASGRRYLQATATPALVVQAYAEVLSRHLPLARKTYASPLSDEAAPLPDPLRHASLPKEADGLSRSL
ncbi:MAG: glycosyltransferase family 4 protein [Cyanobacteriota bacterium]|nr:glycosyltransferase family 4 protein [Cyanobacteriota bacterium]